MNLRIGVFPSKCCITYALTGLRHSQTTHLSASQDPFTTGGITAGVAAHCRSYSILSLHHAAITVRLARLGRVGGDAFVGAGLASLISGESPTERDYVAPCDGRNVLPGEAP